MFKAFGRKKNPKLKPVADRKKGLDGAKPIAKGAPASRPSRKNSVRETATLRAKGAPASRPSGKTSVRKTAGVRVPDRNQLAESRKHLKRPVKAHMPKYSIHPKQLALLAQQGEPSFNPGRAQIEAAAALAATCGGAVWRHSRVMLVGQGRSGKTALLRSMQGLPFEQTESTVGVGRLDCVTASLATKQNSADDGWKIHVEGKGQLAEAMAAQTARVLREGGNDDADATDISHLVGGMGHAYTSWAYEDEDDLLGEYRGAENSNVNNDSPANTTTSSATSHAIVAIEQAHHGAFNKDKERPHQKPQEEEAIPSKLGQNENNDDPVASKLDTELVLKLVHNENNDDAVVFAVWDFGGQEVFTTLHHLFLTRFGVYPLLFSMQWLADDAHKKDREDCIKYIRFWLNSIFVHTSNGSDNMAPVLLVGTHKDIISDPRQHKFISDTLRDEFAGTSAFRFVHPNHDGVTHMGREMLYFFPIDNTQGRNDPVVRQLMSALEEIVREEDYLQQKVPFEWLRVVDMLKSPEYKTQHCITMTEMVGIGKKCGLPLQGDLQEEVVVLLRFLDAMGILMHNEEPQLTNTVVLDPTKFLVEPATKIICHHKERFVKAQAKARQSPYFPRLLEDGVLSGPLVPLLWPDLGEDRRRELLVLMEKYTLLVPLASKHDVSNETLHLVPALLSPSTLTPSKKASLVAYVYFAVDLALSQHDTVDFDLLRRRGFLPMGLFPRILGKVVAWSQATGGQSLRISHNEARVKLGEAIVTLQALNQYNMVRVLVDVNLPHLVERILEHAKAAVAECMPNLQSHLVLPTAKNSSLLVRHERLLQAVKCDNSLIFPAVAGEDDDKVVPSKVLKQVFSQWLPPEGLREIYDGFLSYRWNTYDSAMISDVFDCLSARVSGKDRHRVEMFLDKARLQQGRRFQEDFMDAIYRSPVFVPLISPATLDKFLRLESDSPMDNVLLEWTIALELQEAGHLKRVVPLLRGAVTGDAAVPSSGRLESFFASVQLDKLPHVVPNEVVKVTTSFLKSKGLTPSENLNTRTIHHIVNAMTGNLGVDIAEFDRRGKHAPCRSLFDYATFGCPEAIAKKLLSVLDEVYESQKPTKPNQVELDDVPAPLMRAMTKAASHGENTMTAALSPQEAVAHALDQVERAMQALAQAKEALENVDV